MKTDFKNINWELLSKNLTKEANDFEKKELENWFALDAQNKVLYKSLEKIGQESNRIKSVDKLDVEQALIKVKKAKSEVRYLNFKRLAQIAAILIIVFGLSVVIRFTFGISKMVVVETKENERTEIILADGSEISINENSTLSYPKKFSRQDRKVKLNGEAYFKVTPNKTKPFIIDMDVAYVKVLGTEFNINNYHDEEITVTVNEGSVQFGSSKTNMDTIVLKKGNSGRYDRKNQTLITENNYDANKIAWKTKYLVFDRETLEKIANRLEEVYLIELEVEDELKPLRISAIYNNQPLEMIIQILESTLNINVHKTGENKYKISKI
jgi:ferric-dicitrate binding protein FerR (iron transport regulator)